MTHPFTDWGACARGFDRRNFLTGAIQAAALLTAQKTLALEPQGEQGGTAGCLSALPSGGEARCYLSPASRLRSLESAIPNELSRKNFEQTTSYLLDIGEQAVGFRPRIEIYDKLLGPPNACAAYDFQSCGRSGRILIGYRLLGNILFEPNSTLLYAGIVLHELGHLYQIRSGKRRSADPMFFSRSGRTV